MKKDQTKTDSDAKDKTEGDAKDKTEGDAKDKTDEGKTDGDDKDKTDEGKTDAKTSDKDQKDDEGKTEDKTKDEDKDKTKDESKEKAEPYKIELPDDLAADQKLLGGLEKFANENGISKENAEAFAKEIIGVQQSSIQGVLDTWTEQAKADEEIGGAKFEESVAVAKTAVDRFGGPQLKAALEETGLGSHPEIIKMFYKVGKAMSDDTMFTDGNEKPGKKSEMDSLYPSMVKKN